VASLLSGSVLVSINKLTLHQANNLIQEWLTGFVWVNLYRSFACLLNFLTFFLLIFSFLVLFRIYLYSPRSKDV